MLKIPTRLFLKLTVWRHLQYYQQSSSGPWSSAPETARSNWLPVSNAGLIHIHENKVFRLSQAEGSWFLSALPPNLPDVQHDLCTEQICKLPLIHLHMRVCSPLPSLWHKLFCPKQNSFGRAEYESNGARHLWEWVLAPLGAVAKPIPVSCPPRQTARTWDSD